MRWDCNSKPKEFGGAGHAVSVGIYEVPVESLLGGDGLNYIGHKYCIRKFRTKARKAR